MVLESLMLASAFFIVFNLDCIFYLSIKKNNFIITVEWSSYLLDQDLFQISYQFVVFYRRTETITYTEAEKLFFILRLFIYYIFVLTCFRGSTFWSFALRHCYLHAEKIQDFD